MHRKFAAASLPFLLAACGPPPPLEPTYGNIAAIFDASCSFDTSCHGGTRGAARINFDAARNDGILYTDLLVGVPSCEYDYMPLIDPGHPENSWLYIKVTQAHDADGNILFTPDPSWDPPVRRNSDGSLARQTCPLVESSGGAITFGEIMPDGSSNGLDARRTTALREWILAGAPGPDGTPTPPIDAGPRPMDAGRDAPALDAGDTGAGDTGPVAAPPVDAPAPDDTGTDAG